MERALKHQTSSLDYFLARDTRTKTRVDVTHYDRGGSILASCEVDADGSGDEYNVQLFCNVARVESRRLPLPLGDFDDERRRRMTRIAPS
jgi:hypothetical protein